MANKVGYILELQDKFSKTINRMSTSVERLKNKMPRLSSDAKKASTSLEKVGKSASLVGGPLKALAATLAAGIGFSKMIQEGSQFQASLADLSSITGSTGKDLEFLKQKSLELAKTSVTSQADVANAFKLVASAKSELLEDPKALSNITEQILLLKNAAGVGLEDAANTALRSLNQFGAGADEAARFVNVLAAGSKVGTSEVAQTGAAVLKSGAAARLAGIDFEGLNSMIQVLAKNGIVAEEAGTALKNVILKLETAQSDKLKPSVVGIVQALENLKSAQLDAAELNKFFGLEAIAAGKILIDNTKLVGDWKKAITGTNIAQEQADIRLSVFKKKAEKLGLVIKDKLIKIFLQIEPVLSKAVDGLSNFIDSLDPKAIEAFANIIGLLVKAIVGLAKVINAVLKPIIAVFKGLGTVIGETAAKIFGGVENTGQGTSFKDAFSVGGSFLGVGATKEDIAKVKYSGRARVRNAIDLSSELGEKNIVPIKRMAGRRFRAPSINSGSIASTPVINESKTSEIIKQESKTDINVNLKAPRGSVESVQQNTTGKVSGLNVGINMESAA